MPVRNKTVYGQSSRFDGSRSNSASDRLNKVYQERVDTRHRADNRRGTQNLNNRINKNDFRGSIMDSDYWQTRDEYDQQPTLFEKMVSNIANIFSRKSHKFKAMHRRVLLCNVIEYDDATFTGNYHLVHTKKTSEVTDG